MDRLLALSLSFFHEIANIVILFIALIALFLLENSQPPLFLAILVAMTAGVAVYLIVTTLQKARNIYKVVVKWSKKEQINQP